MYIHSLPKFWTQISNRALFFQKRPKKNAKFLKKLQIPQKISFLISVGQKNYKSRWFSFLVTVGKKNYKSRRKFLF